MATETFSARAAKVKSALLTAKGVLPSKEEGATVPDGQMALEDARKIIVGDMQSLMSELNVLRLGNKDRRGRDIGIGQYMKMKYGFEPEKNGTPESFYAMLGIEPSQHSVSSLLSMPDMPEGYRWLVPEVIREAIRLGLRRSPIYTNLIAAEETVTQPQVIMPSINVSAANVRRIGEAETIPTGTVSFDSKTVQLHKVGTGIKLTDEVVQFVSLNLLSLYLQDIGLNLGNATDTLAIDVLINGEQKDGSASAPVIGVDSTTNGIVYKDILRAWLRMGRIGRTPDSMLSGEDAALKILLLDEFKGIYAGRFALQTLNVKTPIPQTQNYYIHGAMPTTEKLLLVDTSSALIKLNVGSMRVEAERIAENQVSGTYVTMTTGFTTLFRDARLMIDGTQAFSSVGFPSWMDINAYEKNVSLS